MKRNKLILFDWGNIVEAHTTGYSCRRAWDNLFYSCGYRSEEDYYNSLKKYNLSAIPNLDAFIPVYKKMKKEFNFNTSLDEFISLYYKCFDDIDYYSNVRDYEHSLGNKCYIGIFSNLMIFDKDRLDRQVGLSNYDYVFLSFELSCRKPDKEIYEKVQKMLPFSKKDILFIDDKEANVEAAKEFGWNAFCVTGLELDKIKDACDKFLNM